MVLHLPTLNSQILIIYDKTDNRWMKNWKDQRVGSAVNNAPKQKLSYMNS